VLQDYNFKGRTVLLLGRELEGIPAPLLAMLDACTEIPQMGLLRSLNVHVSGAIALYEYTRQRRAGAPAAS
jgi:tRNA guanosine-2'-O-methyltransferase